ncbi:DUF2497 domain-containing protein [Hyphomicrobium sp.]|uniref:DUF2497 domain-containing protein n=1 Tax=Hyphomicrobium sp. TaxID=82 RepID=UPI0035648D09
MSRLESNAEPSMEEILASIRKIIAEDSSGLRSPSTSPRPGAPYTPAPRTAAPQPSPAPGPQRGFMSREAFLKSSQPAEPEPTPEAYEPVSSPATSRLRQREDLQPKEPARPSAKEQASPLKSEPVSPRQSSSDQDTVSVESMTLETMEIVPIEEALPVVKESAPSILKVESETAAKQTVKSDTISIDAQLTELLSEDLNALRQGRGRASLDATAAKADELKVQPSETPRSDATAARPEAESSDPFAFDLGPSPFAPKPEPQQPIQVSSAASSKPSPAPSQLFEPSSAFDAPRITDRPSYAASFTEAGSAEKSAPANGSPYKSPPVPEAARVMPSVSVAPPQPVFESEAPAPKPRQTFAVPSVSATLGPSRKLEPLSNAFQPAPPPPPSALESFVPAAEIAPEPARKSEPARTLEPPVARDRSDETVLHSTLPVTTSDQTFDRPMEDAMADLLRPLLKTWLAENMPKIVERALRREMSERLLPGQTTQKKPQD